MSSTFEIAVAADDGPSAVISTRQVAALLTFLRDESARLNAVLLEPYADTDEPLAAHISPFGLATIARVFDFEADVIRVIDEAQFRGRPVAICRSASTGTITMRVAAAIDGGAEGHPIDAAGQDLLRSPGRNPATIDALPAGTARDPLADAVLRWRAAPFGTGRNLVWTAVAPPAAHGLISDQSPPTFRTRVWPHPSRTANQKPADQKPAKPD